MIRLGLKEWKKLPGAGKIFPGAKRPKFLNRKVKPEERRDGIAFDSVRESRRFDELSMLQASGKISGLRRQVRFPMDINNQRICTYVADFTYYDLIAQEDVVEDSKSTYLAKNDYTFSLKKKLMKALYNVDLRITH